MAGWVGSTRRSELPPNWEAIRKRVLARDGYRCTWVTDGQRCTVRATDVDHRERGDDHSMSNLRSLCGWHHQRRTSRDGGKARAAVRAKRARLGKLPQERHPGLL